MAVEFFLVFENSWQNIRILCLQCVFMSEENTIERLQIITIQESRRVVEKETLQKLERERGKWKRLLKNNEKRMKNWKNKQEGQCITLCH